MARRRLVLCPWALALITGIHQAEGVADPARRTLPPSTGSGGTPLSTGEHPPIPPSLTRNLTRETSSCPTRPQGSLYWR